MGNETLASNPARVYYIYSVQKQELRTLMSHVDGFPDRDGLDKMVKLGKALCALVATFAPILIAKYPGNAKILGLIAAIQSVCALLPGVESDFLIDTGLNEEPLEDPSGINGINPSLPAAIDPSIT